MPILPHGLRAALAAAFLALSTAACAEDPLASAQRPGWPEQLVAEFDGMSLSRLESLFLHCSKESSERVLDLGDAIHCAMAWDALLRRRFSGDVDRLLAWWRLRRDAPDAWQATDRAR